MLSMHIGEYDYWNAIGSKDTGNLLERKLGNAPKLDNKIGYKG